MAQRENLLDVVGLLLRRRKTIALVTAVAAAVCVVISLLLPVYYEARTVFLAASPDQANPRKLFSPTVSVEVYGQGEDIERLIGVALSEETIGHLIDSFNLFEVYEIDPESKRARYDVREAFADLYEVTRTRYDEIEVTVQDQDPVRAAAIANAARVRVEEVVRQVNFQGQSNTAASYRGALSAKASRQRTLRDSLQSLTARYGIVNVESQGEQISGLLDLTDRAISSDSVRLQAYKRLRSRSAALRDSVAIISARLDARRNNRNQIERQLASFAAGSGAVLSLQTESEHLAEQLAFDQEHLRQVESLMGKRAGNVMFIVDEARVPDLKVRPVRWLIVVGGTLLAFILTALSIIVFDGYKRIEWQQYLRE